MTTVGKGLAAGGAILLAAGAVAVYAVLDADDRLLAPAGIVALLGVAVAGFAPVMRGLDAAAPHVAGAIGGTIDAWRYHHALAHERRARVRAERIRDERDARARAEFATRPEPMTVSAAVPAAMRGDVSVMAPGGQVAGADEIVARAREERLMATLEAQTRLAKQANELAAYNTAMATYNSKLAAGQSTQNMGCALILVGLLLSPFVIGIPLMVFGFIAMVASQLQPSKPRKPRP